MYDQGSGLISTVDGNVGLHPDNRANAVSGYDGKAPAFTAMHDGLLVVWRPGLESLGGVAATAPTTNNTEGKKLEQQLDGACHQVIKMYQDLEFMGAVADGQTVAEMAKQSPAG